MILASSSPRRKHLIARLDVPFEIEPATAPERAPNAAEDPASYALSVARDKASEVAARHPERVVVAADTVVAIEGAILGKPRDEDHAISMLRLLNGREHDVFTAVVVRRGPDERFGSVRSTVRMKASTVAEVAAYVRTGEPMDKAGSYALQGQGAALVESFIGCYNNIVGLPLCLTSTLLGDYIGNVVLRSDDDLHHGSAGYRSEC